MNVFFFRPSPPPLKKHGQFTVSTMMAKLQTYLTGSFVIILLASVSSCLADWGQPDKDIAGVSVSKLQKTAKSFDLTSKGRELTWMEDMEYNKDLAVRKWKTGAYFVKDESEESVLRILDIFESEQMTLKAWLEEDKKQRAWLERNCVAGTTLYLYKRRLKYHLNFGYCLIKNGVVVNSFSLGEGGLEPGATPPPNYSTPSNLSTSVQAEAIQPADYPVVITIHATVTGKTPFTYWCGGPGEYPSANMFTAKVTDAQGKVRAVGLTNGQYAMGSGRDIEITSGEEKDIPASLGVQPVGSYRIQVGKGKSLSVDVTVDPELAKKRSGQILLDFRRNQPFARYLAINYHIKPVIDGLLADLTGPDLVAATLAAQTFYGLDPAPNDFAANLAKAMQRQLDSPTDNPMQRQLVWTLISLAGAVGSDDAMAPVLNLIHHNALGLEEGWRGVAVGCLAKFKQPRATEELHALLHDTDPGVRGQAAQILAERKDFTGTEVLRALLHDPNAEVQIQAAKDLAQQGDPAGIEILRARVRHKDAMNRSGAYNALLNFPYDPQYEATLKYGLDDVDNEIQGHAKEAMEKLQRIRKLKNGEF